MYQELLNLSTKKLLPLTLIYLRNGKSVLLMKRVKTKKMMANRWLGLAVGKQINVSHEGKLSWHHIRSLATLHDFAEHQHLFLPKVLADDTFFYSGLACYIQTKLVSYADNIVDDRQCFL